MTVFSGCIVGLCAEKAGMLVVDFVEVVISIGYRTFGVFVGRETGGRVWRVVVVVRKGDLFDESIGRVGYEVCSRVDEGTWDEREIRWGDWVDEWELLSERIVLVDCEWEHMYRIRYIGGEKFVDVWDDNLSGMDGLRCGGAQSRSDMWRKFQVAGEAGAFVGERFGWLSRVMGRGARRSREGC